VLAILGVLAAVVIPNVVGLTGRGEEEGYATDERTIQSAVSVFYTDTHAYSSTGGSADGWNQPGDYTSVNNYPTGSGTASTLYLGNETALGKYRVRVVLNSSDDQPAITADIEAAAIWMPLLVNQPGSGSPCPDGPHVVPRGNSSPLSGEPGPYLNELPRSCSRLNSPVGTGTNTWIVGEHGTVYGAFLYVDKWYAGFAGQYP